MGIDPFSHGTRRSGGVKERDGERAQLLLGSLRQKLVSGTLFDTRIHTWGSPASTASDQYRSVILKVP